MPPKAAPKSERTIARPVLETRDQARTAEAAGPVSPERETDILDALGKTGELILNGETFRMSPWRLGGLKIAAARFGSVSEFGALLAGLMPPFLPDVRDDEGNPVPDMANWEPDLDVLAFCVWLTLRREHPDLNLEEMDDLLPCQQVPLLLIIGKALSVSGLDDAKPENSGPPA